MTAVMRPREASSSWLAVVLVAVFTVTAQYLFLHPLRGHDEIYRPLRFALIGSAGVVLVVALAFRRRWNTKLATWLFVLLVAPFYVIAWISHVRSGRGGEPWVPFEAFRAYFLVLAVLIPGAYWVNALLLIGFAVEALVIWSVLDLPRVETAVLWHEPWGTLFYAVVAAGLFAFRIAHERMALDLRRSRSRAEMLEHVASIFLSIRDRANTPLQTLRLAAAILRTKHPEAVVLADTVSRSTDRIAETSALLARFESKVMWSREQLMTDAEIVDLIERT